MNAFTSGDHTTYPFATTNHKDFNNLLSVYLDATLDPLLNELDFKQEGWRIGPKATTDGDQKLHDENHKGELEFKGVVYNEMKGQMSDASYLYYIRFQESIFPALNNSGGDPDKMTDLSYQALRDFYKKHYRPSNAKIFTYGDMPLADHLRQIDNSLRLFDQGTPQAIDIREPIDLSQGPLYRSVQGPLDPLLDSSKQSKTSTSWLMGDASNIVETFSLKILSSLLLDGYGSPMFRALIESGLGSDFTPNTGFDTSAKTGIFSIGLNGVAKENVDKVKDVISAKLNEVHQNGFDRGKVDGILHQFELALRHKTADFGLGLMQRLEPGWFNGVDPFDSLAWNDTVEAFKRQLAEGKYLESLLEKYLLNDRTFNFKMVSSPTFHEDLATHEQSRLLAKIHEAEQTLGSPSKAFDDFREQEQKLLEAQSRTSNEDLSCLPRLAVSDISRRREDKPTHNSRMDQVQVQWREANTNGLTYFRGINALQGLPSELRMLVPLFTSCILRLGTKHKSVGELEDLMKLKTGGVDLSYFASPSPQNSQVYQEGLSYAGFALDQNVPAMLELLRTLVQETNFDGPMAESQIRQLLQQNTSGVLDAVAESGSQYAGIHAQAGLGVSGVLAEQTGGLTQVQYAVRLAERAPAEGLADVIAKLKTLQSVAIANSCDFRMAITCGSESSSGNEAALRKFLSAFPLSTAIPNAQPTEKLDNFPLKSFFPLPFQVSYSAVALPTVAFVDPKSAPLQILAQLLTHKYLHREIREKGGAYGGGASAQGLGGNFRFSSYRDPNPQNALRTMRNAGAWARDRTWTDEELEEAKLSVFQSLDAPQSVSDEGMLRFQYGVDKKMQQTRREQLLDVTKDDVRNVAQQFLVDGMKNAKTVLLGEQNEWSSPRNGWTVKKIELSKPSDIAGADDLSADDLDPSQMGTVTA